MSVRYYSEVTASVASLFVADEMPAATQILILLFYVRLTYVSREPRGYSRRPPRIWQ
ncbi:MAG: hypothetical protein J6T94_08500 [Bacteroidaceae bacterium]|nr:hypothetical protein [Bacteroidaceae bacterium]